MLTPDLANALLKQINGKAGAPKTWALVVWLLGLALTAWLTLTLYGYQTDRLQDRFNTEVERVFNDMERRFQMPVYGLLGARGVYAASETVNREEFRRYVASRNLAGEFPGVRGMGFIERVPRTELDAFVARERADGAPDFAVRTQGTANDLYVIKFLEPIERNRAALGLDVGSEAVRREAAERAALTGEPALSGVIQLVQDQLPRPGFLLYVPVYRPGLPLETEEQRMAALQGLTYAPIVLQELLDPGLDVWLASGLRIELSNQLRTDGAKPLYSAGPHHAQALLHTELPMMVNGSFLVLQAYSSPALEASANRGLVVALGLAGVLLSSLLAWVFWLQATARSRAEVQVRLMTTDLEKLARVARETSNAVVMTDTTGRIEWVNEGFTRISGYSLQESLGKKPGDFLQCPQTDPQTVATLRAAIGSLQPCSVEILNQHKDGRLYWLELSIQALFHDDGRHTGFMAVETDITGRKKIEVALRLSEARMKAVSELSVQWFWETDTEMRFTHFTSGDVALLAQLNQVALGRKRWEMDVEPLHTTWSEHEATIARRQAFHGFEYRHTDASGHVHYWSASGMPWHNEAGEFVGYIGTGSDISERKNAEVRIAQSEALLDRTAQIAKVGAWRVDLKTGLPEWSAETCRIHDVPVGYRPSMEEALDFYAPEARPVITELVNRGMRSGEGWDVELPFITAQGRAIWVRAVGEVEFEQGQPVALVGGFQDVTQQHHQQDQLRIEQARLRAIYDILPVGISITDPQGHIVDCNPASEQMLGISKVEHLARDYNSKQWVINREDGTPMPAEEFASVRALTQQTPVNDAVMQVITDQHSVWLSVSAMPVQHRDFGVVIAYVDITQKKVQADALMAAKTLAEQASLFKSQFLANMSHEIRTPMNAILGMLQLLHSTTLQPRQLDYVEKTEGAAKSLLGLLNDILDFSKVEAGKMTLDPHPFGLDRLLRDLSVIFSASVGQKPVEVLFDIDPSVPRQLLGDSLRLQQILINLGGNAIKFTAHGEVVLRVRLEALQGEGPGQRAVLNFAVIDSGIGIAPESQQKIFAGFTQAEASTTRRFGGTGLGLSICKRLIDLMGGELQLHSVVGEGSTFSFSLPMAVLEVSPRESALAPWSTPGLPILVVDDNPVARELMVAMGESMGWQVATAEGGESALAMMAARAEQGTPYCAVFVDWLMPGLDGWQTSARIRALNSRAATAAPVIMMVTAHGHEMLAHQTPEVQGLIDGYLVKPVTASMLFDAMQNAVQPDALHKAVPTSVQVSRPLDGLRLLLVEDNAINQQVAEELLSGQGAAVDIADNGLRGVEAVQAAAAIGKLYHAVLMDMQMPVMDGLTAAREIRGRLGLTDLPIIAMTANAMASDREACLQAGMNDHVGKPFDLQRLIATLLQWTRNGLLPHVGEGPAQVVQAKAALVAQLALLNRAAALVRVGGSASLLDRLSTQFLGDLPGLFQACKVAYQDERLDEAQRALHTLKGVAATIGAEALAEAARVAEHACQAGHTVDLEALQSVITQTRHSLLESGVPAPAMRGEDGAAGPAESSAGVVSQAQRAILQRMLLLLEGSDMSVFKVMEELLACDPTQRGTALDQAMQMMDFAQAGALVREALHD
jgi:PAS domain S-box-containing protein